MLTWSQLGPFLLATFLITLSPGPAFALIVRTSALHGWKAARVTLAGVEVGIIVWGLLAAVGVAGVVAASDVAFTAMKIVGALVLLYLGIQAWRGSFRITEAAADALPVPPPGRWPAFGTGLATNLANPKAMVFCLAFFPQFIPRGAPVIPVTLLLVAITVLVDTVWFSAIALTAARARGYFSRSGVRKALDRIAGTVFVALAARMATLVR